MGYFVNGQCVANKGAAEALHYSKVVPILTENGIKQIEYVNNHYTYDNVVLTATFPECDPVQNVALGGSLALAIGLCWAVAYGFVAMKRAL